MTRTNRKTNQKRRVPKYENSIVPMMQLSRSPTVIRRFIVSTTGSVGSDGAGVMAGAFTMDPSAGSSWSSIALLYDQFRVIGGQLKIASRIANNSGAANGLVRFAFDNDSSATPTSIGDISGYSEVTDHPAVWSTGQVLTVNFKRPIVRGVLQGAQQWYNETSPSASPGCLKYYCNGLTASITYLNYVIDYLVEFQMRSS